MSLNGLREKPVEMVAFSARPSDIARESELSAKVSNRLGVFEVCPIVEIASPKLDPILLKKIKNQLLLSRDMLPDPLIGEWLVLFVVTLSTSPSVLRDQAEILITEIHALGKEGGGLD
jgi:hypothetical protein